MNPVGVFLSFSDVFPGYPSNFQAFKSLLLKLSLTDTLFWASRLNLIVSNPCNTDHKAIQQYGLDLFLGPREVEKVNNFVNEYGGFENVTIFFRGQMLELIRWACLFCQDQPDDGRTFEAPEIRRIFVQALLMAGDLWGQRVFGDRFSLKDGIDLGRNRALGAIRRAIGETTVGDDPLMALGRGIVIFTNYFPTFYPDFEKELDSRIGLSVENYFLCLCAIITNYLNRTPEKVVRDPTYSGIFDINTCREQLPADMKLFFSNYLDLESQTPAQLRKALWGYKELDDANEVEPYDLKPLRQRPIVCAPDGRAIVMDPVFYCDKATVGPLFLLTDGVSNMKANQIFSAFGEAFEMYVKGIFERMYPNPVPPLIGRFTYNLTGKNLNKEKVQIADACLNDVTELALFEMKAVWLRDATILDDNYEVYLKHLRERYGISQNNLERPKGYAQLAKAIKKIASQEWVPVGEDFGRVKRIYPVLLVYDSLLDSPVHCNFLAAEFRDTLQPDDKSHGGVMRKGQFLVAPLIVMPIDLLEILEASVAHFSLIQLFRDYTHSCSDRVVSLHNFIATSPQYKEKLHANVSLAARSLEVLNKTLHSFFPDQSLTH